MRWVGNKGFLLASLEPQGAQSLNDDSGTTKRVFLPLSIIKPTGILQREWEHNQTDAVQ